MDDKHFQRALVLLEQSRYDLAERELRQALAADPDHAMAHAVLSQCLLERDDLAQATEEAKTAIRLTPEWPFAHAALARVLAKRNYLRDALASVREALRLDPTDADHYALLASIHLELREWPSALEAAEQGLQHDAEHIGCNNFRAVALTKLGRTAEAGATLAATLSRDPLDPFSHANQGWTSLHERDTKKALEHFREALRLDPELDYAKAGLVEALKARNPIYGLMLRYFLFMSGLSGQARWAIIVGAFLLQQLLSTIGKKNPQWMPIIYPVLVAYIVFAVLTYIAAPLFNLMLRLNRYGRYALSDDQRRGANLVGIMALPALLFLVWLLITDADLAFIGTLYFGLLLLPASAIFQCVAGWPRWTMVAYTVVAACLVPLFFLSSQRDRDLAFLFLQMHVWGCFLSGFVANVLSSMRVKR